ncbi:MAG TPA: HAMP domain-containing protein, partial [Candidatus Acidoferrales bacterium]|nr:HAMP domain-containing protein [Candidatus Acidoferrales bacterium]
MARLACYLAGLAAVLFALQKVLAMFAPSWGEHLGGWVGFLGFLAVAFFSILAFQWLKRRILWRLRNRLIVTYVFIGVIPAVLLVGMALITLYGLAGQFAVFVVTSEIHAQLRSLEAVNAAVSNELAARLERGANPAAESLAGLKKRDPAWGRRQVCAWYGGKSLPLCDEFRGAALTAPRFSEGKFRDIVRDGDGLHLRVVNSLQVGSEQLTVVTSEPFDKELVGKIAADLGEITLYGSGFGSEESSSKGDSLAKTNGQPTPRQGSGPHINVNLNPPKNKGGIVITQSNGSAAQADQRVLQPSFTVGALAGPAGSFDSKIDFGTPLPVVDWKTGEHEQVGAVVQVSTRPSVLYGHLFASLGEFVRGVAYILLGVAIFFAIIELVALFIGTRMTRTVTAAVAQMHEATKYIDRGDFSHRIPVKSSDQLADLAISFNSMTASIEKLIQEQKEKQRLENELA